MSELIGSIKKENALAQFCAQVVGPDEAKRYAQRSIYRDEQHGRELNGILRLMWPEIRRVIGK